MTYARTTQTGIETGTFRDLWPNTSPPTDKASFAASKGYSSVVSTRPFVAPLQVLEPCAVYEEAGTFYSVRVVAASMDAIRLAVDDVVQARLDAFAKTRLYASVLSATSYAGSKNPQRAMEGAYLLDVRDLTWDVCYAALNAIVSGQRPMPASLEAFATELPVLAWPDAV